jgi:hypothetical protein
MPGTSERKRPLARRTFSIFELIDALATALDAIFWEAARNGTLTHLEDAAAGRAFAVH